MKKDGLQGLASGLVRLECIFKTYYFLKILTLFLDYFIIKVYSYKCVDQLKKRLLKTLSSKKIEIS